MAEGYHGSHLIFTASGGAGCYSGVGRDLLGKGQYINLGSPECYAVGTIIHETIHSLGLFRLLCLEGDESTLQAPSTSNQGLIVTSTSPYSGTISNLAEKRISENRKLRPSTPGTLHLTIRASCSILLMPLGKRMVWEEERQLSSH